MKTEQTIIAEEKPAAQQAKAVHTEARIMKPSHINPAQWDHAVGYARQSCARIFRHGGSPVDAISSFGIAGRKADANWGNAVERIAISLCAPGR